MFAMAQKAVARNLSVREVENMVKAANRALRTDVIADTDVGVQVDYTAELEKRATTLSGHRIKIQSGKRKKIVLVEYQNEEDLEELLIKLCGSEIVEG